MSARTTEILNEVLSMPAEERAELVESILSSLEPCDPRILELWAAEAEDRVAAFERSEIEAVSAESVFEEIDREIAK
jgi:putative addiction module component (TIGR02574 family)